MPSNLFRLALKSLHQSPAVAPEDESPIKIRYIINPIALFLKRKRKILIKNIFEKLGEKMSLKEISGNSVCHKKKSSNIAPIGIATVHWGSFTDINNKTCAVAVKKYPTNGSTFTSISTYERTIETLKFLSLPGNKHPNFIRFFEASQTIQPTNGFKYIYICIYLC